MHSSVLLIIVLLINLGALYSMPSTMSMYPNDYSFDEDDFDALAKRLTFPQWIHKRNPGLCDYRLQLRPLPLTSALCAYGRCRI